PSPLHPHATQQSPHESSPQPPSLPPSSPLPTTSHPDSSSTSSRHWNGWGYRDTEFTLTSTGDIALAGHRYAYSGKTMPHLRAWMEARTGIDVKDATPSQAEPTCPPPTLNEPFLAAITQHCHHIDQSDRDRLFHAHGHTAQEVYTLRFGVFPRVPDIIVYPLTSSH